MKKILARNSALDVFRGMAIAIMILVDAVPDFNAVPPILAHSPWQGITLADLAFPGFVFSMGVSAAFSFRHGAHRSPGEWRRKILQRIFRLFLLGLLVNAMPAFFDLLLVPGYDGAAFFDQAVAHGRIPSVLGRLALTYGLGMGLLLLLKSRGRLSVAAFALLFVSSLGFHIYAPADPFAPGHNISQAVDLVVPGAAHVCPYYDFPFDPEGLYGTLASTASMLFGCLAGQMLSGNDSARAKFPVLFGSGLCLLMMGWAWSFFDIISKPLWTAPYALLTSGGSLALLACLDASFQNFPRMAAWFRPFLAFGANPLLWYVVTNMALMLLWELPSPDPDISSYTWLWLQWSEGFGQTPATAAAHMVLWSILWWPLAEVFYRRGILVKI